MNKITAEHVSRRACVYVRQSTPDQVQNNLESQRRQYALVERLSVRAEPLLRQRMEPPVLKAQLTADGGICPADGSPAKAASTLNARPR